MITVACMLWGDWPAGEDYVTRLYNGVKKHLKQDFRFVCMTDWPILVGVPEAVEILPLPCPHFKRNLRKMVYYQPHNGLHGQVLAVDLDNVVTGSLDDIASYRGRFCTLEDLYDGNGVAGGGLIGFDAEDRSLADALYYPVVANPDEIAMQTAGGSERHWFRRRMHSPDFWQKLYPGQIVSAKPDRKVRETIPEEARMVCFHGRHKPHDYTHLEWVKQNWK